MNYREILKQMFIDYGERLEKESNLDKKIIYREVLRDLSLILDIEPNQIALVQQANNILNP